MILYLVWTVPAALSGTPSQSLIFNGHIICCGYKIGSISCFANHQMTSLSLSGSEWSVRFILIFSLRSFPVVTVQHSRHPCKHLPLWATSGRQRAVDDRWMALVGQWATHHSLSAYTRVRCPEISPLSPMPIVSPAPAVPPFPSLVLFIYRRWCIPYPLASYQG